MKHAILIQAHKNFNQVHKLISFFDKDCDVFVHIDKKATFTKENLQELTSMTNVKKVYQKYSVHWGGISILKCELFLVKEALKHSNAEYFHLLSGQDYPIKPLHEILSFFEENKGKEFLEFVHLPSPIWEKNTYERFRYFFLNNWLPRTPKATEFIVKTIEWQKKWGIKRRIPDYFDHLYGGSAWFSITREASNKLLTYTKKKPAFYRRLNYTFGSDEVYVNTVLGNLIPTENISKKNYRYIRWKNENGNYPANLGKEHFYLLAENDSFFARKLEMPYSEPLTQLIDRYLLQDTPISVSETGAWNYNSFRKYTYDAFLADAIFTFSKWMQIETAIEMGCGAGFYVAALRKKGLPIAGYDANPHTTELSSLLLPENDVPCDVADLTDDLDNDESFDLVLCLDVCHYIPKYYEEKVIQNLAYLSGKYIILSWATSEQEKEDYINKHSNEEIEEAFGKHGFIKNQIATNFLRRQAKFDDLREGTIVLEKISCK